MNRKIYLATALSFVLAACGNQKNEESNEQNQNHEEPIACFYSYNPEKTTLKWEAYKTTNRVGVGGTFNQINVTTSVDSSSKLLEVIQSIKFAIPTNTVNSNNPGRDEKITKFFFGTMAKTDIIIGQVKEITGDDKSGKAIIYITLNDIEKEAEFDYTIDDATVTLNGYINMEDYMATASVDSLNQQCYDLHKGEDGVSKLWPDVSISIESTFNKNCH